MARDLLADLLKEQKKQTKLLQEIKALLKKNKEISVSSVDAAFELGLKSVIDVMDSDLN